MNTESKHFNLTPKTTGFFKRNDSVPEIGYEREILEAAFKITNEKKLPEKVIKGTKGYYVIKLRDRKMPEFDGFNEEKAAIKQRLLQQKKARTFNELLVQIKSKSDYH